MDKDIHNGAVQTFNRAYPSAKSQWRRERRARPRERASVEVVFAIRCSRLQEGAGTIRSTALARVAAGLSGAVSSEVNESLLEVHDARSVRGALALRETL